MTLRATLTRALAGPLAAQPKLLVNAKLDTRSGAALQREVQTLATTQPQPAWIMYSVPSVRTYNLGCDYVRDGAGAAGVVHLEPPDHALILFRVDGNAVTRVRSLSPNCEIDAGDVPVHWLTDVQPADSIALLGPSGSGKSTLLHLIAGLDEPTSGSIEWPALGGRWDLRPGPVGIAFQGPSLLPPLTVVENVALPMILAGADEDDATAAARDLLDVGADLF